MLLYQNLIVDFQNEVLRQNCSNYVIQDVDKTVLLSNRLTLLEKGPSLEADNP